MYKTENFWFYEGEKFDSPSKDFVGFVYIITNKKSGKMYIGKKLLWRKVRYKTKPKIRIKDSNWREYFGSSKAMLKDIEEQGHQDFDRKILKFCKSKGELTYCELKEQIDREVLLKDEYYNNFLGCKIHGKHLSGMRNE